MLTGKVAVVTGGSRGIGAAIVKKLASLGADVAVIYAGSQDLAEQICTACRAEYGVKAQAYCCDVADFQATKETVGQIKADFGTVHVLVNNAGITRDGLMMRMKDEDFDAVLSTNLRGAFLMTRACAGTMVRRRFGRIVNISSVSGLCGNAGQANYSAAKAGMIGLTKSVARELAGRGITCNAIAPGFIETDMTAALPEKVREASIASIPMKRMGRPEEIAALVCFLCSEPAGYLTGEVIRIDGGLAM